MDTHMTCTSGGTAEAGHTSAPELLAPPAGRGLAGHRPQPRPLLAGSEPSKKTTIQTHL